MISGEHHEAIWEALPEGLEPSDFGLRRAFLLGEVAAGERVLDLGCGEGAFAAELARAGVEVVAADVAREPLRRAAARHPGLELALIEPHGPWHAFADNSFDVVWAGEVIEHVADTHAWLSELRRVLRSGGRLLLSTPDHGRLRVARLAFSRGAFAGHFDPLGDHLRFYSATSLSATLQSFGFERVQLRRVGGPPGARKTLLARAVRSRF
ncbi:MAG TPA: class I SAM-dependent methyltransferase [Solirubrobacteraceae bacterium]